MFSRKLLVALLTIAIIGTAAVVLGCTSPTPTPTPVPTGNPTVTPAPLTGTIAISGSTTIQPVSELLAKAFHGNNTGVIITVQGGGSGKGMTDIGTGLVDIGSASEAVPQSTLDKYPSIHTTQIGASAVVAIVNAADAVTTISKSDLVKLYNNVSDDKPDAFKDFTVYKRAETSGTADTFSSYVLGNKSAIYNAAQTTGATGNPGIVNGVASAPKSIGFADYGFAISNSGVKIIGIVDGSTTYPAPTRASLLQVLKNTSTSYPMGLTRPLNYLTNGAPTGTVKDYIDYVLSTQAVWAFDQNGFFSMQDLK
jgi:phosphate transport system substrate-binding protein